MKEEKISLLTHSKEGLGRGAGGGGGGATETATSRQKLVAPKMRDISRWLLVIVIIHVQSVIVGVY